MPFTAHYPGGSFQPFSVENEGTGLQALNASMEKKKEETKKRAQMKRSLEGYASASGLLSSDQAKVMGADELEGFMRGAVLKDEMARRQHQDALVVQQLEELNARSTAADRFGKAAATYLDEIFPGESADPRVLMGIAAQSGFGPSEIGAVMKAAKEAGMIGAKDLNEIDIGELGRPRNVPGLPDSVFIPTSKGGGQVINTKDKAEKPRSTGRLRPAIDQVTKRPIPGVFVDEDTGEIIKQSENPLTAILQGTAPTAPTQPSQPTGGSWFDRFKTWQNRLKAK